MTLLAELDDLLPAVQNDTPQLDTHPDQHNALTELVGAVVAAFGKPVEWFGAIGDGVADDTQAFRDAAENGGLVKLLANKTYRVTETLTLDTAGTWVVGEGESSVIKQTGAAFFTAFQATDLAGLRFATFRLDSSALPAPRIGSLDATAAVGATTIALKAGHTLTDGTVVYIGNPEFLPASADTGDPSTLTYETKTLSNVSATGASLSSPIVRTAGYGARTVVVQTAGGVGGHGLKATSCTGVTFDDVTFYKTARHCLWLLDCSDVRVEACHFEDFGYALAAADVESAFTFAIGGFSVSRLVVTRNVFGPSRGRRSACVELRIPLSGAFGRHDLGDTIISHNIIAQITTDTLQYDAGAGFNLVCAERDYGWSRIAIIGNTFDSVGDGFIWVVNEAGPVSVTGNAFTNGTKGPFIEVTAPNISITGNTMKGGVAYAGIWARISPGTGDFSGGQNGVDFCCATIVGNTIRDLYGSNSVGIWIDAGANAPANGPRSFVINSNTIEGCNQDGIQVYLGEGDYQILGNVIKDANAASRARTTLLAPVTFTADQDAVLTVDAEDEGFEWLVANQFVHIYSGATDTDVNSRQIHSVDREAGTITIVGNTRDGYAGTFDAGAHVVNPFPGSAGIWLRGDAEHPSGNVEVAHNRVGQGPLGSTLRGLRLDDVSGVVVNVFNNFAGCPQELTTVNSPRVFTYNPATKWAGWQTDLSPNAPDRIHLRDWQWRWANAAGTQLASSSVAAGSTTLVLASATALAAAFAAKLVSLAVWIGYPGAVNAETQMIATDWDGSTTLALNGGTKFDHGASTLAAEAALDAVSFTVQAGHGARFVTGQVVQFAGDTANAYEVGAVVGDVVGLASGVTLAQTYASGSAVGEPIRVAANALRAEFWGNDYDPDSGNGSGHVLRVGWVPERQAFGIRAQTTGGEHYQASNLDIETPTSADQIRFGPGGSFDVIVTPGAIRPRVNGGASSGIEGARWSTVYMNEARVTAANYAADGAIAIKTGASAKLSKTSAGAYTLANPTSAEDGLTLTLVATTAFAHKVTASTGGFNNAGSGSAVATFGGAVGDHMRLLAAGNRWYVLGSRNVTLGAS